MTVPHVFDKDRIAWDRRLDLVNRDGQSASGLAEIANLASQLSLDILYFLMKGVDAFGSFLWRRTCRPQRQLCERSFFGLQLLNKISVGLVFTGFGQEAIFDD